MQIIRPGIDIAIVIGLDAVGVAVILQIDTEAGVRETGVTQDSVVDRAGVMNPDSGARSITHRSAPAIEGDDVARVSGRTANSVIMSVNLYAARGIAQRLCACDIGADDVTLNEVAGGVLSEDQTRVAIVARDQIARRRAGSSCQASDGAVRDASIEIHAKVWITQGDCACNIRADKVALDGIVRSTEQFNAAIVCGYDVTGVSSRTADGII